jgi:hypothetical protein
MKRLSRIKNGRRRITLTEFSSLLSFIFVKYPRGYTVQSLQFSSGGSMEKWSYQKTISRNLPGDFPGPLVGPALLIPFAQKPALISAKDERNQPWQTEKLEDYGCADS